VNGAIQIAMIGAASDAMNQTLLRFFGMQPYAPFTFGPAYAFTQNFQQTANGGFTADGTGAADIEAQAILPLTLACPAKTGEVNVSYSSALVASGGVSPYTFSINGSLPGGLTLNPSTGAITGTPTTSGTFSFSAEVVDSSGNSASDEAFGCCSITITQPMPLSMGCGSCGAGNAKVGAPYTSTMSVANGTAPYTFSITSGSLPPGLTLNTTTGVISGTPTTAGTYTFAVKVVDATGKSDTTTCVIKVEGQPIELQCGSCGGGGDATVGTFYSESLSVFNGTSPFTFSIVSGSLPPGLTLNTSTGAITGIPNTPGDYSFTVKVVDKNGDTDTATCSIKVTQPKQSCDLDLQCGSCGNVGDGKVGTPYSAVLSATGGTGPYTFLILNGSLPWGVSLGNGGAISGTPTVAGSYTFTSQVVDRSGKSDFATCTVRVVAPPLDLACGTCGATKANTGVYYSALLSATGGTGPYTYSIASGALPPGVTLNPATGQIAGTPTTTGTYVFTSKVVDSTGASDTAVCILFVWNSWGW
jgi:hypothetical protein